ncbi:hypothetical protein [Leisingera sp.]|uniref:hypothetical protein n=1 Tax=Leisingera sp. TaxID=1879318 RepID=UPI002B2680BF|nr:hypothetical protein [Leisingera sp.]
MRPIQITTRNQVGNALIGAYTADFNGLTDAGETYLIYGGTDILNRFDLADGVQDDEIQLALLGENPADYDLPI